MQPLDIECYPNYYLICIGEQFWELTARKENNLGSNIKLLKALELPTYGFNTYKYDLPMIRAAMQGKTTAELHTISKTIIKKNLFPWDTYELFGINERQPRIINHVDLMEPAPGVMVSLKKYGIRMHSQSIEHLPYPPTATLTYKQMKRVREYCQNDLALTRNLYDAIADRIALRTTIECGEDLRSKSDAQIAEVVIRDRLGYSKRARIPETATFTLPDPSAFDLNFRRFELSELKRKLVEHEYFVNPNNGQVMLPSWLEPIKIGNGTYRVGIGGLHSSEKSRSVTAGKTQQIIDADVTSYYPSIILERGLYPEHLSDKFLGIYREFYNERIAAKAAGERTKAEGFKIVLNGSFGKFGSRYSTLYSPSLLINVTLTGQLCLLLLIEMLEDKGIEVLSANTDGVMALVKRHKRSTYRWVLARWQSRVPFALEFTRYCALHSRDVNNYLAVKPDGQYKGKGVYAETGLMKDPAGSIIQEAAREWFINGTDPETTVANCDDVRKFIFGRNVTGGGDWGGKPIGSPVRWMWTRTGKSILAAKSGNQVALADSCIPVVNLPTRVLKVTDLARYAEAAKDLINLSGGRIK